MFRFIHSSPEALGPFGFTLMFSAMGFLNALHRTHDGSFGARMWESVWASFFSTVPVLLFFLFFFRHSSKPRSESVLLREKRGREERLRVGYLAIARDVFLVDLGASSFTVTMEFFFFPNQAHFSYGQFLFAGLLATIFATGINTLYLKLSDRLVLDPPRPNLPATKQVHWLFRGNE